MRQNNTPWNEREIAVLRELYADASREQILSLLPGRSYNTICRKASKLHIRRSVEGEWSDRELEILIRDYPLRKARHLLPLLPGRSLASIYRKARELSLQAYDNTAIDTAIRQQFGKCSLYRIAKDIGCCRSSIRYRAQLLGLL